MFPQPLFPKKFSTASFFTEEPLVPAASLAPEFPTGLFFHSGIPSSRILFFPRISTASFCTGIPLFPPPLFPQNFPQSLFYWEPFVPVTSFSPEFPTASSFTGTPCSRSLYYPEFPTASFFTRYPLLPQPLFSQNFPQPLFTGNRSQSPFFPEFPTPFFPSASISQEIFHSLFFHRGTSSSRSLSFPRISHSLSFH